MSGTTTSSATYTNTLLFAVSLYQSTQVSRKTLFDGRLGIGTNVFQSMENQLSPGQSATITSVTQIFAIFTDNDLQITVYDSSGSKIDNEITALTIMEGAFPTIIIENLSSNSNPSNFYSIWA